MTARLRVPDSAVPLSVAIYLALFALASAQFSLPAGPLATVPVVLAAWSRGRRGVLWVSLGLIAGHGLLALLGPAYALEGYELAWGALLLALGFGLGAVRDLGERERAALSAAEQRFERALREAHDVLWEWDMVSGSAFFSSRFQELVGSGRPTLPTRISEWFERVHPEELEPLHSAIEEHRRGESERFEHVHRLRRHDGSYVWVAAGGLITRNAQGEPIRMTGWLSDVTEQRRSEAQLRRLALQDALTGLPNRVLFMDRLEQAHERARRRQRDYAVVLVDLDRFKVINDSFGHALGDLLLMKVARILRDTVRPGDTIARLGGDEFVILLEELDQPEQADEIANEVLGTLVQPIEVDGHRVVVGASIGMSRGSGQRGALRPEEILREADIAMYKAKSMGGERVDVYDPNGQNNLAERLDLENELRRALDGETLHVHYQPIVDVEAGVVVGFEALARWHHPRLGPVSPGKFIPIAEELGLIDRLGECVLRVACRDAAKLKRSFPDAAPFRMGVNLSVAQLAHTDLCARVAQALAESGLTADYLGLEITESGLLEDTEGAVRIFSQLQEMGVRLSMDDFGTGYSSLHYLRRFRIDTLKIDGSFVRDMEHTAGEEICATIINLGKDLGLSVVAEGVEHPEELQRLRRLGGRYAQGFLLSRPLPFEQLCAWLESMPGWRMKMAS